MAVYPDFLPCPMIEGYGIDTAPEISRVTFDSGYTRQRRLHKRLARVVDLSFTIKQSPAYARWLNWVNNNAWEWFQISIPSDLSSQQPAIQTVRFIGNLATQVVRSTDDYWWKVTVRAEIDS